VTSLADLTGPWLLLRRHRDLRLLLGAGLVSMCGDWLLSVGLTYSVYAVTGSTLASAMTMLAAFLPQVLVGTVAGVFVDRWDRRRTMVVTNLLLAAGLAPLVLADTTAHIWVVYLVLVGQSVVEVFFAPAQQALLPRLVPDDGLVTANALNGQVRELSRLAGAALGGVAAAAGGITAVALLDALSFVLATLLLIRIRVDGRPGAGQPAAGQPAAGQPADPGGLVLGRLAQLRREWLDGLRTAWESRVVRMLLVFSLVTCTGEGVMGALFAPYVRSVLHGGPQLLGALSSVQAVGGLAGGVIVATVGRGWSPVRMLGAGAVLFGLVDLGIFVYPLVVVSPWPALAGMVLVGTPGAALTAGMMTLYQRSTVDERRGRVLGLAFFAQSLAMVVGTTGAGFLGAVVGIVPVLAFQGVGYVVAGVLVLTTLRTEAVAPSPMVGV
jgi:Na+/melibiose symporter-like transporter